MTPPKTFADVVERDCCRYIGNSGFCGHERKEESSYCADHHSVCYQKRRKRNTDDSALLELILGGQAPE